MNSDICYLGRLNSIEVQLCMQYLNTTELLKFARCNKRILNDAASPFAFKHMWKFYFNAHNMAEYPKLKTNILQYHPAIVYIGSFGEQYLRAPAEFRSLYKHLCIDGLCDSYINNEDFLNDLRHNKISSIRLGDCTLDATDINEILQAIGENTNTTSLKLDNIRIFTNEKTIEILAKNKALKSLEISGYGKPNDCILKTLIKNNTLTKLKLESFNRRTSVIQLTNAIKLNTSLVILNITNYMLDAEIIQNLAQLINNGTLRELSLIGSHMSRESLAPIIDAIISSTKLTHIDLSKNDISAKNLDSIVNMIRLNQNLKTLRLINNGLNLDDIKVLSNCMKNHACLENIDVTYNAYDSYQDTVITRDNYKDFLLKVEA